MQVCRKQWHVKWAVQPLYPLYHNALLYPFLLALGRNNKEIGPKTNAESYCVDDAWNKSHYPPSMLFPLPQTYLMHFRCFPLAFAHHLPKPCLLSAGCTSSFWKGAWSLREGLGKLLFFPSGTEINLDQVFPAFLNICFLNISPVLMQAPSRKAICSDTAQ